MSEFSYIKDFFSSLSTDGLINDGCAMSTLSDERQYVVTKDIITKGVHFFGDEPPDRIARKALRVNLSDIASMGATPYGYFIGLILSRSVNREWIEDFSYGLQEDGKIFKMSLLGGDTTSCIQEDFCAISVTMFGITNTDGELKRSGAQNGDFVYVSGNIGDASLFLNNKKNGFMSNNYLQNRYEIPDSRIDIGCHIKDFASSCIDISDGLFQDASHICQESKVGMDLFLEDIPTSSHVYDFTDNKSKNLEIAFAGDDYELLFTSSQENEDHLRLLLGCKAIHKIGKIHAGENIVRILDKSGDALNNTFKGYNHF